MNDGLGSTSYIYDQLSRLTSETRTITGVGTFPLSYEYNLANEVTSITDPFGGTINYGFDATGRLSTVNGSGYGSVTQFAYGMQYRAWGGLKSVSYNSSRSLSLSYNRRLNVTLFQLNGQNQTAGAEYQYYNDGQIKYSRDLSDGRFDRSYTYDHVMRLTSSFTGAQARGGTAADGPYRETYAYDTRDNSTERTGRHWSETLQPVTFTYDNSTNRNSQWQYDAEGNTLQQALRQYTFDAAGRQVLTSEDTNFLGHEFDGDGLTVKHTNGGWVGYYVRSTVLNGEIIAEVDAQGQYWRRYIYSNGHLLAEVHQNGQVSWTHRSPSNNTEWVSAATSFGRTQEFDPLGTQVGSEDPYVDPDPGGGGFDDWSAGLGEPTDLTTGCSWEGMSIGCNYAVKIVYGMRGYGDRSRRHSISITLRSVPGGGLHWLQFSDVKSRVFQTDENGTYFEEIAGWSPGQILVYKNFVSSPYGHHTSIVRQTKPQKPVIRGHNIVQTMRNLLEDSRCSNFISNLINVARQLTGRNPYSYDANELIDAISNQPSNSHFEGIDFPNGYNFSGVGNGGSAFGDIRRGEASVYAPASTYWNRPPTRSDIIRAQVHLALIGLHETIHVAGGARTARDGSQAYYTDRVLAEAAQVLTDAPGFPEPGSENSFYGSYWDQQLREHCFPK